MPVLARIHFLERGESLTSANASPIRRLRERNLREKSYMHHSQALAVVTTIVAIEEKLGPVNFQIKVRRRLL